MMSVFYFDGFLKFKKDVDMLHFQVLRTKHIIVLLYMILCTCGVALDEIQTRIQRHVWDNHKYSTLVYYFLEKYKLDKHFLQDSKDICEIYQSNTLSIPFSKLHSCPTCEQKQETVPLLFFHALQFLKLFIPYDDYFTHSCQTTVPRQLKN